MQPAATDTLPPSVRQCCISTKQPDWTWLRLLSLRRDRMVEDRMHAHADLPVRRMEGGPQHAPSHYIAAPVQAQTKG